MVRLSCSMDFVGYVRGVVIWFFDKLIPCTNPARLHLESIRLGPVTKAPTGRQLESQGQSARSLSASPLVAFGKTFGALKGRNIYVQSALNHIEAVRSNGESSALSGLQNILRIVTRGDAPPLALRRSAPGFRVAAPLGLW
jgi:hypothetical protein